MPIILFIFFVITTILALWLVNGKITVTPSTKLIINLFIIVNIVLWIVYILWHGLPLFTYKF